jgi:hypothetical protein
VSFVNHPNELVLTIIVIVMILLTCNVLLSGMCAPSLWLRLFVGGWVVRMAPSHVE